jgi:uncharacterized protein YdhG (YjbR/CyaY superfamily)
MLSVRLRRTVALTLMAPSNGKPGSVDEYIASFEPEVRAILQKVRATVRAAAPGATEIISYRMPALKQHGVLVYFAAFKSHIGFYPPSEEAPNWSTKRPCTRARRETFDSRWTSPFRTS